MLTGSASQHKAAPGYRHQAPPGKSLDRNILPKKKQISAGQRKEERASKCFPLVDKACYFFFPLQRK